MVVSMNHHKGKLLIFSLTVFLVCIVFTIKFLKLPIPFVTNSIAAKELKRYVGEDNLYVKYDFKNNSYYISNGGNRISYDFIENRIFDEKLSSKFNEHAKTLYVKFYKRKGEARFPDDIHLHTEVNAKDYRQIEQKIYLLNIYERKEFDSEEELKKRMLELMFEVIEFLGDEFNITSCQINYICLNGTFSLEYNSRKNLKNVSEPELRDNIYTSERDGENEEFLRWKNDLD